MIVLILATIYELLFEKLNEHTGTMMLMFLFAEVLIVYPILLTTYFIWRAK